MKNICQIFITDFKRIKTNVVAVVIMLGLIILPSLYAWFNILSNWDPYGEASTSKIKVAVASDDEGVDIEGTYFNMGDKVISALESAGCLQIRHRKPLMVYTVETITQL